MTHFAPKKRHNILPTENISEKESSREQLAPGIFALLFCCALLYLQQPLIAIFCFGAFLVFRLNKLPLFFEKHSERIFIIISMLIIAVGIAIRIVMLIKYRSLWVDEAMLAESIIARNWKELLTPPLSNEQSAPVLYVVAVKAACSVFGASENSLRLFSEFSFVWLFALEWFFFKDILKMDNVKTAFAMALTAVVPSFIFYSNELKPYMSDAFFVVLALLLYAYYVQNRLSLIKLTVFYALILGFSTPAVFFIGGILATEFLALAFAKDKKRALHVAISGASIIAVFVLYYYWWMLPAQKFMDALWNGSPDKSLFEVFFIALAISLYFLYMLKKPPLIYLTICYLLIIGFCPPAVFFAGGILVVEFFAAVFAKNKKEFVPILAHILSIAMMFSLYYLLRTQFVAGSLDNFYNNPQGKTKLVTEVKDIFSSTVVRGFDSTLVYVLVPFALFGIYSLIKQRNKIAYSVVLSMFFVCLASSIGKWPLNPRLWLFLPAVILLYSFVGLDLISKSNNIVIRRAVFCLFFGITLNFALPNLSLLKESVYINNEEVNPLIQYVKDNIKNDENLYVYGPAVHTFKFKNGYKSLRIGKTTRNNIIYGVKREEWNQTEPGPELNSIIESRKAYLLFQHWYFGIGNGLGVLERHGKVTRVLNNYETPLFYFEAHE
jgi:hypothetical protein